MEWKRRKKYAIFCICRNTPNKSIWWRNKKNEKDRGHSEELVEQRKWAIGLEGNDQGCTKRFVSLRLRRFWAIFVSFRVTSKWGDCFVYVFVLRQNGEIVSFTFSCYVKMGRSFLYVFVLRFLKKNVSYSPGSALLGIRMAGWILRSLRLKHDST